MAVNLSKKAAVETTTKTVKQKGKVLSEDTVSQNVPLPELKPGPVVVDSAVEPVTPEPWCEVGLEASYTHNLGDYKSCRVGVTIKIPCRHNEIDEAFDYGETWVNAKMEKMMTEITS